MPTAEVVPVSNRGLTSWRYVDWNKAIPIALMHVGCIAAPLLFTWEGVGVAVALWWLCGGIGICLCYHRLLTHRSFKCPKWFEYLLTLIATTNWQGGPIEWVGTHRIHHRHSDHDEDPHSPKHGFNWAHILWCVTKNDGSYVPASAAQDLVRDPAMRFIDRHHYAAQFVLAAILFAIGAWQWGAGWSLMNGVTWVVWGVCVRLVFTYHATWFVNSAAHTWGYRSHQTKDDSRNLWWVAVLSFGEGWHNNHHACDRAAAHGRRWWELDLTYLTIRALALVGLAWAIVPATESKRAPSIGQPPAMVEAKPAEVPAQHIA